MKSLALLLCFPVLVLSQGQLPPKNLADKNERLKAERLPPCKGCMTVVKSFEEGKKIIKFFF